MRVEFFKLYENNILVGFEKLFCVAKERNLDFGIFSHNCLNESEQDKIKALLETKEVHKAAVSVGVGRITGKGFIFSPKFPFVSEDGIIINVKRCEELGIPGRLTDVYTHSHFEDAGGPHATLLSFLEAVVPYGELYTYSYESDYKDVYESWQERAVQKILQYVKGIFNRVDYEIQKKYDKE